MLSFWDILKLVLTAAVIQLVHPVFTCSSSPAGTYLLKVNNRNTRTRCEICSTAGRLWDSEKYTSPNVLSFLGVEIAAGNRIFPTRKWKSRAVWNFEILKMSGRVMAFYLRRNCWFKKLIVYFAVFITPADLT